MSGRGLAAAILLSAGLAGCVTATTGQGAVRTDMLTISGRDAIAVAPPGSPLAGRLVVTDVVISDAVATALDLDPALLRADLKAAFERSLINHGYLAQGEAAAGGVPLTIQISAPALTVDAEGTTAVVDMTFAVPADHDQAPCLSYAGQTRFRAVERMKSGGGERTAAVVAGVLMAAAGANSGVFMADQFRNADADNAALNARRTLAHGEGLTPVGSRPGQFASLHAIRLGMAGYLRRLGDPRTCGGVGVPAIVVSRLAGA